MLNCTLQLAIAAADLLDCSCYCVSLSGDLYVVFVVVASTDDFVCERVKSNL